MGQLKDIDLTRNQLFIRLENYASTSDTDTHIQL